VVPVFVLDPALIEGARQAPARLRFLFASLADLDRQLRKKNGRLIVRSGDPVVTLREIAGECGAKAVYFHSDITPYARARDARVAGALSEAGIETRTFNDAYLAAPTEVLKGDGAPYTVYTPYRRRFESVVAIPGRLPGTGRLNTPVRLRSDALPNPADQSANLCMRGGATEALRQWKEFLAGADGLSQYGDRRDFMAQDGTSRLSAHLHFGTISIRELARGARGLEPKVRAHAELWIGELIWREFFAQVLWHFPYAAAGCFRRKYDALEWENDKEKFAAWCEGRTGYPVVDAAMRQMKETGWMHNRARMIVASFLTKDLLIDWRWGERYFIQNLIDGDPASNNGGWQWAASTGTDALPSFRIFNPVEQGKRFDPEGDYIRRWIPELARLSASEIQTPWLLPEKWRAGYPLPIVNHAERRARALDLFQSVRPR
jgi:deoxyribodipyrimidine photo-lyase